MLKKIISIIVVMGVLAGVYFAYDIISERIRRLEILKLMIDRMSGDTRVADVLVTDVSYDETSSKYQTTIKFLEYDSYGRPMKAKYFTFQGNIIQFQSLVIRFDDDYVQQGDLLRGKSLHLFWKVFMLDGEQTEEYEIGPAGQIPQAYKLDGVQDGIERELWRNFWDYALRPDQREDAGVKNAQIEAPGTKFIPGTLYTIRIEHDGGLRIDTSPIPEILRGERIL